ncbi:MAG TPA: hypothetical protein VFJ17_00760 [Mycobacteriales bacterium]|jgi:hypothetical protein|nr:hypothetical protein [Mycobacteriales bacterium]
MRRALITTVGLAGLAATALPVLAAPAPADEGRTAGIQVTTKLPDGDTLRLDISASLLSDGAHLVINTVRCDGANNCVTQPYAGALPGDALSISASDPQAALTTTLSGQQLSISWKPMANGGYSIGGGTLDGDGPDTFATEYMGTSADTSVLYDGLGCTGVGGVGDGVVVDTAPVSGSEVALPLSALHLPDGTAFHC